MMLRKEHLLVNKHSMNETMIIPITLDSSEDLGRWHVKVVIPKDRVSKHSTREENLGPVMVNFGCQLDWIWNQVGEKLLDTAIRDILEQVN